eukprot:CAMPEP_0181355338 /NCGR_PEP_ID=MMETSP1106-20121128/3844_1 /TAXON_ID=81844 /ORGANISM="Mantoniella antarctica, Strain SL-175" /LENGTH=119 /DNA_ID=CAMNT_0023468067 /DNA_START=526 /DNA_END=881 /DNA_ORIENTATION=+
MDVQHPTFNVQRPTSSQRVKFPLRSPAVCSGPRSAPALYCPLTSRAFFFLFFFRFFTTVILPRAYLGSLTLVSTWHEKSISSPLSGFIRCPINESLSTPSPSLPPAPAATATTAPATPA